MTSDLLLRALEPSDATEVHALVTEPSVARTLGGTPFDRESSWLERLREARSDRSSHVGAFLGARLVGLASLEGEPSVRRRHVARLSVGVRASMQRKGVGTALVGALVDAADRWWGYTRIELGVVADHRAAIALYEKHGFVVETRRSAEMLVDGALVDCLGMARLRPGFVPLPAIGEPPPVPARGPARPGVTIRPRRASDAESFARLHETPSVMEGTFQMPFQSASQWEARFASTPESAPIFVADLDGEVVGSAGLFPLGQSPRFRHVAMFGISVRPDVQGAGVGHALTSAAMEHADRWLGLTRVALEVFVDNDRARALYERHGFVVEGVERAMALRRGTHADSYLMARVRPRP